MKVISRKNTEAEMKSASKELPGQVNTHSEAQSNFSIPSKADLLASDLVSIDNLHRSVMANTIKIADYFGKRPSEINRKITSLKERGLCKIAPSYYVNGQGKKQIYYLLNRQQFAQVVLGFTGNKADLFRLEYTQAFVRKDAELNAWRAERKNLADSTKVANDAVYKLQSSLKEQYPESKKSGFLFIHLHSAINKIVTGKCSITRDMLSQYELEEIARLEAAINEAIGSQLNEDPMIVRHEIMTGIKSGYFGDDSGIKK
jgi:Rha family phage regulatory protein